MVSELAPEASADCYSAIAVCDCFIAVVVVVFLYMIDLFSHVLAFRIIVFVGIPRTAMAIFIRSMSCGVSCTVVVSCALVLTALE
jgi:hypothetical protein